MRQALCQSPHSRRRNRRNAFKKLEPAEAKEIFDEAITGAITEEQMKDGYGSFTRGTARPIERNIEKPKSKKKFDAIEPEKITDDKGYMFSETLDKSSIAPGKITVLPVNDPLLRDEAAMATRYRPGKALCTKEVLMKSLRP